MQNKVQSLHPNIGKFRAFFYEKLEEEALTNDTVLEINYTSLNS